MTSSDTASRLETTVVPISVFIFWCGPSVLHNSVQHWSTVGKVHQDFGHESLELVTAEVTTDEFVNFPRFFTFMHVVVFDTISIIALFRSFKWDGLFVRL